MEVDADALGCDLASLREIQKKKLRLQAVNQPGFRGILSFFTQPGKMFADEIGERLKVITCLEKPNMLPPSDLENGYFKWATGQCPSASNKLASPAVFSGKNYLIEIKSADRMLRDASDKPFAIE